MECNRGQHVGMETLVHRASQGRMFQGAPARVGRRQRQMNIDLQFADPAYRLLNHLLGDGDPGAAQVNLVPGGEDPHDRGHTASERGGHQIGRRKSLAFTAIVDRRVGY